MDGISTVLRRIFGPAHPQHAISGVWLVVPLMLLAGHWFTSDHILLLFAICLPIGVIIASTRIKQKPQPLADGGLPDRADLLQHVERAIAHCSKGRCEYALFAFELDRISEISQTYGPGVLRDAIALVHHRVGRVTRQGDVLARIDESRFALLTAPMRTSDPDTLLDIVDRCQAAVGEMTEIGKLRLSLSISVGFATPRMSIERTPAALLDAAERALIDAKKCGGSAVRGYDPVTRTEETEASDLTEEILPALASGQIEALYQPIVDTNDGRVTAMEVTPVWEHPKLGRLMWPDFKAEAVASGQLIDIRLAVLRHALNSTLSWRGAGIEVPRLNLEVGRLDIAEPHFVDLLKRELERFGYSPDLLTLSLGGDVVIRNAEDAVHGHIRRLVNSGFSTAIDGFGTSGTSLQILRHLGVSQIRIGRGFVEDIDIREDQRRLFDAVLQMTDVLGAGLLATGVDSIAEHAMLAQLGCDCVQGLAISAPMPFPETPNWLNRHRSKLKYNAVSSPKATTA